MAYVERNPSFPTSFRIEHEGASVRCSSWSNGKINLICLETKVRDRGKGYAKKVLAMAKRIAVRTGRKLCLDIGPYSSCEWDDTTKCYVHCKPPMDFEQLDKFYASMGFEPTDEDYPAHREWVPE